MPIALNIVLILWALGGGPPRALAARPRVLVHITDVHLSTHERLLPFGSIRSDLASLITNVLNPVTSDAVLVTGDLVDAKDYHGGGRQYEDERAAWAAIASTIDATVLTVPGNHDRFDTGLSTDQAGRVSVRALMGDGMVVEDVGGKCPVAILVGIDASPRLGLRSPANFLALTTDMDVKVFTKEMSVVDGFKGACPPDHDPLVVTFGHYPLSVFSEAHAVGLRGALSHAFGGMGCLDHPVSDLIAQKANIYLCGHLHSLFGRLHRVHDARSGHVGGRLNELEAAAWKDQRSFRIVVIDSTADSTCASFADYYFLTPDSPQYVARSDTDLEQRRRDGWESSFAERGWGLTSHEGAGFSLNGTMVIITSPADPSLPDMCSFNGSRHHKHDVRALVLMPSNEGDVAATAVLTTTNGSALGMLPLVLDNAPRGSNQRLFVGSHNGQLVQRLDAVSLYVLHVEVRQARTGRIIAVSPPRTVSSDGAQIPLKQNVIEFITLTVNWANLAHRVYLLAVVILLFALAHFGTGSRRSVLMAYVSYQLVGPLYACMLLSQSWPFMAFQHGTLMMVSAMDALMPSLPYVLTRSLACDYRCYRVCCRTNRSCTDG